MPLHHTLIWLFVLKDAGTSFGACPVVQPADMDFTGPLSKILFFVPILREGKVVARPWIQVLRS